LNSSTPPAPLPEGLDPERLPVHVAIIMDGNGRWAKKRLLNRVKGHEKGSEAVRRIVRTCRELGIRYLTLYAFSTENWQRPKTEVQALMMLLTRFLKSEEDELMENRIRLSVIGQFERLPEKVRGEMNRVMEKTRDNETMTLTLALSYGGRDEILRMARLAAEEALSGKIKPQDIDEAYVNAHLYTARLPDPDLLIRTSGEMRISNFLLWQVAYAEIAVTKTLWPDFTREEFLEILKEFQSRDRRFGAVRV
jgi:undecaprenyl diphosphate synthase